MQQTTLPFHEAAILGRLAWPCARAPSAAAADGILALEFCRVDKQRMHALAAKARTGELNGGEQAEVEAYSRVSSLLGILKSQARRAQNRQRGNGKRTAR